jgi:hypothetical protein
MCFFSLLCSGVDHCGHRYGPSHQEMKRKLNQMDDVIRNITTMFNNDNRSSLLMVIGDHGMTQQGDHGGDEPNEIETAMFIYTNRPNYFSFVSSARHRSVSQIDLVPTLAWFLHTLIPYSSLGMMIIDILPVEQRYIAMKFNFEQMESYLETISSTLPLSDVLQEHRATLRASLMSIDRTRNLTRVEQIFQNYRIELQTHFRRQWSTFNIVRIVLGLLVMFVACSSMIVLQSMPFNAQINRVRLIVDVSLAFGYVVMAFSNSFIIHEGMCLYFLVQTIVLVMYRTDTTQQVLLMCLVFSTRSFLVCREEQQPFCVDPQWLISKSSDTFVDIFPYVSPIVWLIIFLSTCSLSNILPYLSYVSVIAYWLDMPYALSIFYLNVFVQLIVSIFSRDRSYDLIYSFLMFTVGCRFSLVILVEYVIYRQLAKAVDVPSGLLLSMLADYFFFATGHQPVLSQIRWIAAFPTAHSSIDVYLSSFVNSMFVRGTCVVFETFSSQIVHVVVIRQLFHRRHQSNIFSRILLIDSTKLFVTSVSVFVFRRHLMLWKIFCPRFLFHILALTIKCVFIVLTMPKNP